MEKKRIKIECTCSETFSRLLEPKGEVIVTCPFCKTESKLVFQSSSVVDLMRDGERVRRLEV